MIDQLLMFDCFTCDRHTFTFEKHTLIRCPFCGESTMSNPSVIDCFTVNESMIMSAERNQETGRSFQVR